MTFSVNENDYAETLNASYCSKSILFCRTKMGVFNMRFYNRLAVLTCNPIYPLADAKNNCHPYYFNGSASSLKVQTTHSQTAYVQFPNVVG